MRGGDTNRDGVRTLEGRGSYQEGEWWRKVVATWGRMRGGWMIGRGWVGEGGRGFRKVGEDGGS